MRIALLQLNSKLEPAPNLKVIEEMLLEGKSQGIKTFFLPECFYSISDGLTPSPHLIDLDMGEDDPHYQAIARLARDHQVALLGGSVATKMGAAVINRNYNFNERGIELAHYDKIHLFNCALEDRSINEADIYTPGTLPQMLEYEELKIGLGVCFDLRFSKMAHDYRALGANLLTYSSAFTVPTGRAHWHILLRARAIENQCFVVAPAQWGYHNERIQTYGHSLVVDPWGEVIADGGEGEKLVVAEIDLARIAEVRKRMSM